jgi:endonuclease-3
MTEPDDVTGHNQRLSDDWDEVFAGLAARYGHPRWHSSGPPLDELIATVLSQHTSDANSSRAYENLRGRFPTWEDAAEAPVYEVAAAIQTGGLANVKAPRIQAILHAVAGASGAYTIDWLAGRPLPQAREWLLALPGVGHKTAACVLLFSLGLPAMPVDTHVHRVVRRLGLTDPKEDAEQVCATMEAAIGPNRDAIFALHMNLVRHGRTTCHARRPRCGSCVLRDVCPNASLPGDD